MPYPSYNYWHIQLNWVNTFMPSSKCARFVASERRCYAASQTSQRWKAHRHTHSHDQGNLSHCDWHHFANFFLKTPFQKLMYYYSLFLKWIFSHSAHYSLHVSLSLPPSRFLSLGVFWRTCMLRMDGNSLYFLLHVLILLLRIPEGIRAKFSVINSCT